MVDAKTDAIDQIVKKRDWLAVERLRMFRLQRAIDAYAQRIDSELQECVEAGRVLGVKINLPIWENVWKTSLEKEMARVCAVSEWTRPEQSMRLLGQAPGNATDPIALETAVKRGAAESRDPRLKVS